MDPALEEGHKCEPKNLSVFVADVSEQTLDFADFVQSISVVP